MKKELKELQARVECLEKGHDWRFKWTVFRSAPIMSFGLDNGCRIEATCNRCGKTSTIYLSDKEAKVIARALSRLPKGAI